MMRLHNGTSLSTVVDLNQLLNTIFTSKCFFVEMIFDLILLVDMNTVKNLCMKSVVSDYDESYRQSAFIHNVIMYTATLQGIDEE